jgi:preprotein translocase subunit SecY
MPEILPASDSAALTAEELWLLRCVVADYRAGRRIARFVFRVFLMLGALGAAATGFISGWHSLMGAFGHVVLPPPSPP